MTFRGKKTRISTPFYSKNIFCVYSVPSTVLDMEKIKARLSVNYTTIATGMHALSLNHFKNHTHTQIIFKSILTYKINNEKKLFINNCMKVVKPAYTFPPNLNRTLNYLHYFQPSHWLVCVSQTITVLLLAVPTATAPWT